MMTNVISIRVNKRLEELIKNLAVETQLDQSDALREVMNNGIVFIAIKGYAEGKYSVEKAAAMAGMPLSEFMDLTTSLGIRSKIDLDDVLAGSDNLKSQVGK
nr:UPF0175 family protein [Candidatus Sigynarchaeota archaeon]